VTRADASFAVVYPAAKGWCWKSPGALFGGDVRSVAPMRLGRRECQVLCGSARGRTQLASQCRPPEHRASNGGFVLDDEWLTAFSWQTREAGGRHLAQVHTHPSRPFTLRRMMVSIVHLKGFLSSSYRTSLWGSSRLTTRTSLRWDRMASSHHVEPTVAVEDRLTTFSGEPMSSDVTHGGQQSFASRMNCAGCT
jgi:hypothetical protein